MEKNNLGFDLSLIAEVFELNRTAKSEVLNKWLSSTFTLSVEENHILDKIYEEIAEDGDYWNEEELKIKAVGLLFFLADITVKNKIKVFYERPLSAKIRGYTISVITDCMVATPMIFNSPKMPYFFLQERNAARFKKGKGEKKDPEAQMLSAMLIAQEINHDNLPIYGGFLVGSNWRYCTLIGKDYCLSRQYDASNKADLLQIVFILRKLKDLILNR
jgi:hypothetical protein